MVLSSPFFLADGSSPVHLSALLKTVFCINGHPKPEKEPTALMKRDDGKAMDCRRQFQKDGLGVRVEGLG